jgi:hypothetical protein
MIFATPAHGQASRVIARRMRSGRQVLAVRADEPGGEEAALLDHLDAYARG